MASKESEFGEETTVVRVAGVGSNIEKKFCTQSSNTNYCDSNWAGSHELASVLTVVKRACSGYSAVMISRIRVGQ
jgi:hypothetical protein